MKNPAIGLAAPVCFFSSLAFAGDIWTLDSNTSNARLFQGSKTKSDSVNTGVARVNGKVRLDPNVPGNSIFDLSIYPADEDWGRAQRPAESLSPGYVPGPSEQTLLTFKSTRILRTENGKFEVIGNLTLTRVEHTITATPTEAYAGPVYDNPVIHSDTHEIKFQFSAAPSPAALTSAAFQNKNTQKIVGSARVGHEDFPQLLGAIKETNWPSVVQNRVCRAPSTVGEDYNGAQCSGTLVAATSYDNCHMPASVGEDYSGLLCTPATGTQTTIVLDLNLLHPMSEPSAGMFSGYSETR